MAVISRIKGFVAVCALVAVGATTAVAQGCDTTEFSSKNGQLYLAAENALMVEDDAATALAKLNELRRNELNCYEEGAALRLSAAVKVETGDYMGAVADLEAAIARGYVPADQVATTYYNIAQLYLQEEDMPKAISYMERWMNAGGAPDRMRCTCRMPIVGRAGAAGRGALRKSADALPARAALMSARRAR